MTYRCQVGAAAASADAAKASFAASGPAVRAPAGGEADPEPAGDVLELPQPKADAAEVMAL